MEELKFIAEQGGAWLVVAVLLGVGHKILQIFTKTIVPLLEKMSENHFTHIEEYTKETRDIMIEHNQISKENSERQIEILNEIKNKL